MKLIAVVLALTLLVSACGVTTQQFTLQDVKPNTLTMVRFQDFWSTTYVPIFKADNGQIAFPKAESGTSVAGFSSTILGIAVGGVGLGYIGHQLPKINTGTSTVNVKDLPAELPAGIQMPVGMTQ